MADTAATTKILPLMTSFHNASQSAIRGHDPLLDRLQTPVWIFDIEQERMHYPPLIHQGAECGG